MERDAQEDIKRLLILLLFKLGSTSDEIAIALGVDSSRVRQMFPVKKIKKIAKAVGESSS